MRCVVKEAGATGSTATPVKHAAAITLRRQSLMTLCDIHMPGRSKLSR